MIDDPLNPAGVQGPKPFGEPVEDGLGTRNAERNILGHGLGKSPRLIHYIQGAPIRKSSSVSNRWAEMAVSSMHSTTTSATWIRGSHRGWISGRSRFTPSRPA